eukprot:Rhum_TRINITY_DN15224_c2_g1::Rhum_TRINITY_DN15224_c2_g1_i6::g.145616::m.145616
MDVVPIRNFGTCFWMERWYRHTVVPGDSQDVQLRKAIVLMFSLVVGFVSTVAFLWVMAAYGVKKTFTKIYGLNFAVTGSCSIFALTYMSVAKRCSDALLYFLLAGTAAGVLMADWAAASGLAMRGWPFLVIVVDLLLVLRAPRYFARFLVCVVSLWLLVVAIEQTFRFGFFDLPGQPDLETRTRVCACDNPPCRDATAIVSAIQFIGVFVCDFYFTRRFADDVLKEQARVETSITAALHVAECLSLFDLKGAEDLLLQEREKLPDGMTNALHVLLHNLRCYKPYLPAGLVEHLHPTEGDTTNVPPPGVDSGEACIVFTDIVGSTALWEKVPSMSDALKVHNAVMRDACRRHGGYEVKTIGDAFMVAFETAEAGVRFGLDVQEQLYVAAWPRDLLRLPECAKAGPWCGLTVRIGAHAGPVSLEVNPLSGRADYFGPTVNQAARTETAAPQGVVAVCEQLFDSLGGGLRGHITSRLGITTFKGISETVPLVAVYAPALVERKLGRAQKSAALSAESLLRPQAPHVPPPSPSIWRENVASATVCSLEVSAPQEAAVRATSSLAESVVSCGGDVWNEQLKGVLTSTLRCGGEVIALSGRSVLAGWNVTTRCTRHLENFMMLAKLVGRMPAAQRPSIGASSGSVVVGTFGNERHRFVNVVGECVDMSKYLAELARLHAHSFLYSPLSGGESFERLGLALCCFEGVVDPRWQGFDLYTNAPHTPPSVNEPRAPFPSQAP